jgi:tRNA dimethylallyltransferase
MSQKTCLIIAGPTAVGKTSLAIDLALQYNTRIISADSRQCYKEMNIGVAKPSAEQLAAVHHYFINSHSITEEVTAAAFEQYALKAADEIFSQHDLAIMVGGTGLYIKAFCEGLDSIPVIDPAIRALIIQSYESNGIEWLQARIKEEDPDFFSHGEIQNPQRMMRALEVKRSTGQSIRNFQQGKQAQRPFRIIKLGLELPRELLYAQIDNRVDEMMAAGLLEEVKSLYQYRSLNALQTVGYTELFDSLDGKISIDDAVELIKRNTRHYAKRQITWFKKSGIQCNLDPRQSFLVKAFVARELHADM